MSTPKKEPKRTLLNTPAAEWEWSATQLDHACDRRWAFDKIEGREKPEWASTILGNDTHTALEEKYHGMGEPTRADVARLLEPCNAFLPEVSGQWRLATPGEERARTFAGHSGQWVFEPEWWHSEGLFVGVLSQSQAPDVRVRGYKDLRLKNRGVYAPNQRTRDGAEVRLIDLKTTVDFQWCKTSETLATADTQAAVYAQNIADEDGVHFVRGRWLYTRTKGAAIAVPVDFTIHVLGDAHKRNIERIASRARRLISDIRPRAIAYEPNWSACDSYGGCPYRGECDVADTIENVYYRYLTQNPSKPTKEEEPMTLPAPNQAAAPPVQDGRAHLAHEEYTDAGGNTAYRVVQAANGKRLPDAIILQQQVWVPSRNGWVNIQWPAPIDPDVSAALSEAAAHHAAAPAILPPEAAHSPATAHAQPPPPATAAAPAGFAPPPMGPPAAPQAPGGFPNAFFPPGPPGAPPGQAAPAGFTPPTGPATPAPQTFGTVATPPATEPAKRKRRTKAEMAAAAAAGGAPPGQATPASDAAIGELFVDCRPDGEEILDVGHIVAKHAAAGAGAMAAVLADIDASRPEAVAVSLSSRDGAALYDALVARAFRVVRGGS